MEERNPIDIIIKNGYIEEIINNIGVKMTLSKTSMLSCLNMTKKNLKN